ncbi:NUDIX domain-containing protein [Nanohaloarchaea archaeon H01]|nr:NUDIX domain-containing protein [Nanohaloarchaea archaeon H01]
MINYTGEVTVNVVENNGEYLLAERSRDNKWEFVGGKVEAGETIKEAALRELKEEVELQAEIIEINGSYPSADNPEWELVPVHMESYSRDVELANEHLQYDWIEPEEISEYDTIGQEKALELLDLI